MTIRCLIVDDEPIAIKVVQAHLEKVPDVAVVATCNSALEAFDIVRKQPVDLVFLDIQMPHLTGIGFVKALEHPPKIIFTTAYREYALDGFELDVVDYLLKPISFPRLLRAIDKYRKLYQPRTVPEASPSSPASEPFINIKADRTTVKVRLADILFIESLSDYVKVHTSGRTLISRQRISHLAETLAPHQFIRIHRSFLVPIPRITAFTAEEVQLGSRTLPISRTYKQAVLERLRHDDTG